MMTLVTQAIITAILATGVGFLIRQNGVVSFGHAAFYGIACYTIALALKLGVMRVDHEEPAYFDDERIRLLTAVGSQTALAEPMIGQSLNTYGLPGAVDTPTAEMLPANSSPMRSCM